MPVFSSCSPQHAVAWSEALTVSGVEDFTAYAYQPLGRTVALGLSQQVDREVNRDAARADGVGLLRRASGGGAVFLGDGVLCFGVIAPFGGMDDFGIHAAFRLLTAHVVDALASFGVAAGLSGISDIAATVKSEDEAASHFKIAGTAQLRKKNAVLVHGSILVDADMTLLERYLAFPSQTPEYRRNRSHTNFCRTVSALAGRVVSCPALTTAIRDAAQQRGWTWRAVPEILPACAETLLREKYRSENWTLHRKRPVL